MGRAACLGASLASGLALFACTSGGLTPAAAVPTPAAPAPRALRAPEASPAIGEDPAPKAVVAEAKPASNDLDAFNRSIKPMLAQSCAPCHVPGGQMYERLPWDDAATVRSHADGILRRLKDEKRAAFEAWLASAQ